MTANMDQQSNITDAPCHQADILKQRNKTLIFMAISVSLLPHAMQYGIQASLISEQFPVQIRYTGAGLGYQLSSLIAGGPAPLVASFLWAKFATGYAVAAYLVFGGIVAALSFSLMEDRGNESIWGIS